MTACALNAHNEHGRISNAILKIRIVNIMLGYDPAATLERIFEGCNWRKVAFRMNVDNKDNKTLLAL